MHELLAEQRELYPTVSLAFKEVMDNRKHLWGETRQETKEAAPGDAGASAGGSSAEKRAREEDRDGGQSDEEDAPTSTAANQFTNTPSVTRTVRHAPRVVRFKERISSSVSSSVTVAGVSLGDAHVVCVDTCGKLWTWGSNRQGQLGRPSVGYARHELSLESELEDSDFDPRPVSLLGPAPCPSR